MQGKRLARNSRPRVSDAMRGWHLPHPSASIHSHATTKQAPRGLCTVGFNPHPFPSSGAVPPMRQHQGASEGGGEEEMFADIKAGLGCNSNHPS